MVKKYKVAVVGAGVVGLELIRILKQREFPMKELRVLARRARTINIDKRHLSIRQLFFLSFALFFDLSLFPDVKINFCIPIICSDLKLFSCSSLSSTLNIKGCFGTFYVLQPNIHKFFFRSNKR